jgi:hypothetical protein
MHILKGTLHTYYVKQAEMTKQQVSYICWYVKWENELNQNYFINMTTKSEASGVQQDIKHDC